MYLDYCFIVILLVLFECIDIKSNFFILLLLPCNICIVLNSVIFVTTNILWIFIPISIWFSSLFVHCCHLWPYLFHILIFFSEITGANWIKLGGNVTWVVLETFVEFHFIWNFNMTQLSLLFFLIGWYCTYFLKNHMCDWIFTM